MAETIFEKIGEDEFLLKGDLGGMKTIGWKWMDFFEFVGDNIVWTDSDESCSIVRRDPPEYDYSVDFVYTGSKGGKQKLEITARTMHNAVSTVNGLLSFASSINQEEDEITLKCFATTPRALLAPLDPISDHLSCLRLQFVALDSQTCESLLGSSSVSHLELRQCVMEGFFDALSNSPAAGPEKLTISCTMPEFSKLAGSFAGNKAIKELKLQLHFFLQGESLFTFTSSLGENKGIEELAVQYLDITDNGWKALCISLHNHPSIKKVAMAFTDNFADNFRRLTPERRAARTQDVLNLVQVNDNIVEFTWPKFQQDDILQNSIDSILKSNRIAKAAKMVSCS